MAAFGRSSAMSDGRGPLLSILFSKISSKVPGRSRRSWTAAPYASFGFNRSPCRRGTCRHPSANGQSLLTSLPSRAWGLLGTRDGMIGWKRFTCERPGARTGRNAKRRTRPANQSRRERNSRPWRGDSRLFEKVQRAAAAFRSAAQKESKITILG